MFKRLSHASDERSKDQVKSINKTLTKIKNIVKNVPKDKVTRVEENEKIIRARTKNTNSKPNA